MSKFAECFLHFISTPIFTTIGTTPPRPDISIDSIAEHVVRMVGISL